LEAEVPIRLVVVHNFLVEDSRLVVHIHEVHILEGHNFEVDNHFEVHNFLAEDSLLMVHILVVDSR
jgi:hypothetical protein